MARNESTNPALTRSPAFAGAGTPVGFDRQPRPGQGRSDLPQWQEPAAQGDPVEQAYFGPTATSRDTGRMTVEDVTVRTGLLLATAVITGAATWVLGLEALAFPALLIGFVLALVITFKSITNPAVILTYAAVEGVFLGGISKVFNSAYPGIVVQAVIGTAAVALATLAMYRSGRIRVTPKFTKMVIAATMGYMGLLLVNLVAGLFGANLGLFDGGLLSIGISLFAVGLASLNLVLDFEFIHQGAKQGMPERFGWLAAFGLMVTLVWLYIEILRLLSYLRGDD